MQFARTEKARLVRTGYITGNEKLADILNSKNKYYKTLIHLLRDKVAQDMLCKVVNSKNNRYGNPWQVSDYGMYTTYRFKKHQDALFIGDNWSYTDANPLVKASRNATAKVVRTTERIIKLMNFA